MIEGLLNLGGHQLLSLGVWALFNDFLIYYEKLVWCFFSSRTKTAIKFPKVQLIFDHRRGLQLTHDLRALSISYWSIAQEPGTQEDPISSTSSWKCRLRGISIVGHSFLVQPLKKSWYKRKTCDIGIDAAVWDGWSAIDYSKWDPVEKPTTAK